MWGGGENVYNLYDYIGFACLCVPMSVRAHAMHAWIEGMEELEELDNVKAEGARTQASHALLPCRDALSRRM